MVFSSGRLAYGYETSIWVIRSSSSCKFLKFKIHQNFERTPSALESQKEGAESMMEREGAPPDGNRSRQSTGERSRLRNDCRSSFCQSQGRSRRENLLLLLDRMRAE